MTSEPSTAEGNSVYSGKPFELATRIEYLALRLVGQNWNTPSDLWQLQLDFLQLQQDIQKEIADTKGRPKNKKASSEPLESLKLCRWLARRLGDAFAWALLNDRRLLYPFSHNDPVPIPQKGYGTQGLLAISQHLSNDGWGFPLLHDITDIMRIGDVTFIKPDTSEHRTIEVKTRHLGNSVGDDGDDLARYSVDISFLEMRPENSSAKHDHAPPARPISGDSEEVPRSKRPDRRIGRQTQRMANVVMYSESKVDTIFEVDGRKSIKTYVDSTPNHHWEDVRRIIADARSTGYASTCIDGSFLYAALYSPTGLTPETMDNARFVTDVQESGLLATEGRHECSLTISTIPEEQGRSAHLYLPFYLYRIPPESISDLIHGRLLITVFTNAGKIASALEGNGIEVDISDAKNPLHSMVFSHEEMDGDGFRYRAELRNMQLHIRESIYEFRGVNYLRDIITQMRNTTRIAVNEISPLKRDAGDLTSDT
ncbi:hypothetical protein [Streptomyces sp. NBC_01013]|uniref:hypothetical protein n=1 Tax=Streptomyces sp. NBC_01013 TaxID=2903718 RepID=UPI003864B959|nr:hypothetical protein OG538_19110 [Streptomyces sp. NBC_01013]